MQSDTDMEQLRVDRLDDFRLSRFQNDADRLVSGPRRHDHVLPILRSLHWLPVRRRVTFKSAVIAWKPVNGVAPTYLLELCVPVEDVRDRPRLRSASTRCISLPSVQTSTGQRSFGYSGPAMWNNPHQPCANFIGFTYFLILSIPTVSTRIVTLRFQADGRRRRPNLVLVCCVCVTCIP